MRILAIVPARSGSKGIPNKNIASLGDRPLLYYALSALSESKSISEICVTTDSIKYIEIVKDYFPEIISVLRPDFLAGDVTPDIPVLLDALEQYANIRKDYKPTHVLMVHATSPLLLPSDIDDSIATFTASHLHDSMVSVVSCQHPFYKHKVIDDGFLRPAPYAPNEISTSRRQDTAPIYVRNGAFYLMKVDQLKSDRMWGEHVLPYIMPRLRSVDINDYEDLELASLILSHKKDV